MNGGNNSGIKERVTIYVVAQAVHADDGIRD